MAGHGEGERLRRDRHRRRPQRSRRRRAARQGRPRVVVLERRDVVGGAAVTEQPLGPDFKVTALSYVVSLMPPAICASSSWSGTATTSTRRARTSRPYADGRYLLLPDDPPRGAGRSRKFSAHGRRRDRRVGRVARRPRRRARRRCSPRSRRSSARSGPATSLDLGAARLAAPALDQRTVGEITRLFTMCIADLVEDRFESDAMRGVLSVSGVIGTWAGPRSPGTAYVMAHHKIGDVGDGSKLGAVGLPRGRHGRRSRGALRAAAERSARGADRRAGRADPRATTAGSTGVVLASARRSRPPS